MSTEVASKTARIIALDSVAQKRGHIKVVDVETTNSNPTHHKPHKQATAAPVAGEFPTYMVGATGGVNKQGLPIIFISGYSGPQ